MPANNGETKDPSLWKWGLLIGLLAVLSVMLTADW
jgi:hypothetical protein